LNLMPFEAGVQMEMDLAEDLRRAVKIGATLTANKTGPFKAISLRLMGAVSLATGIFGMLERGGAKNSSAHRRQAVTRPARVLKNPRFRPDTK
jgi:hypothetical protein